MKKIRTLGLAILLTGVVGSITSAQAEFTANEFLSAEETADVANQPLANRFNRCVELRMNAGVPREQAERLCFGVLEMIDAMRILGAPVKELFDKASKQL